MNYYPTKYLSMSKLLYLSILYSFSSYGQIFAGQEIAVSKLNSWEEKRIEGYEGIYAFGFSEAETEFTIAVNGNNVNAQLKSGYWKEQNGKLIGWQYVYSNYSNVRIEGRFFYSDESNGEFVLLEKEGGFIKCLKLNKPPVQTGVEGQFEIAERIEATYEDLIGGKYPETKFELLSEHELKQRTPEELRIMRNEIFARYGYIFRAGGEMESYFKRQAWYKGTEKSVDSWLTTIEKDNIKLIQKVEQLKNN